LVTLALKMRSSEAAIPPELADLFSEVASGLEEILNDIRELSRGIHPAALSRAGLAAALRTLGERAPLPVDVAVRLSRRPAERIETAVYYVVAEALTNVAKHAHASRAVVEVDSADGLVRVAVQGLRTSRPPGSGRRTRRHHDAAQPGIGSHHPDRRASNGIVHPAAPAARTASRTC
jgi:signal transduction histidine kinase